MSVQSQTRLSLPDTFIVEHRDSCMFGGLALQIYYWPYSTTLWQEANKREAELTLRFDEQSLSILLIYTSANIASKQKQLKLNLTGGISVKTPFCLNSSIASL